MLSGLCSEAPPRRCLSCSVLGVQAFVLRVARKDVASGSSENAFLSVIFSVGVSAGTLAEADVRSVDSSISARSLSVLLMCSFLSLRLSLSCRGSLRFAVHGFSGTRLRRLRWTGNRWKRIAFLWRENRRSFRIRKVRLDRCLIDRLTSFEALGRALPVLEHLREETSLLAQCQKVPSEPQASASVVARAGSALRPGSSAVES